MKIVFNIIIAVIFVFLLVDVGFFLKYLKIFSPLLFYLTGAIINFFLLCISIECKERFVIKKQNSKIKEFLGD